MDKKIAAKIYLNYITHKDDAAYLSLLISKYSQKGDIDKIIKAYEQIKQGEIKVAVVKSSIKLEEEQKQGIENKVKSKFNDDLVFIYSIDPDLLGGITIEIDDNIIDLSIATKINRMDIKSDKTSND